MAAKYNIPPLFYYNFITIIIMVSHIYDFYIAPYSARVLFDGALQYYYPVSDLLQSNTHFNPEGGIQLVLPL